MGSSFVSRLASAITAATGLFGCSGIASDDTATSAPQVRSMVLHGQRRVPDAVQPRGASAPAGAHLDYFGGRIMSRIQVVQVIYGTGSYLPEVTSTATPSMATFYQGVLNSPYVDWLGEYNTTTQPPPSSNQTLGRGSFLRQATITPSAVNDGSVIDDAQIQAELAAQIEAGSLPGPSHDARGNNNTYYAVFFPHGKTITLNGLSSCSFFCAYHGTIADAGGAGEISYGVHPDLQPGSGCELGCGAAATAFGNATQVASHELVETMTDPEIGLTTDIAAPVAWIDSANGEIGDICNDQNGQVIGSDGVTYDVQPEFSNALNDCVVTSPLASPVILGPPGEVCRGTTDVTSVTVMGGTGRFTSPVTLGLAAVSPGPPPGGEITATFDPDPVPTPPASGATSTMRIATTAATPPGTYALTVRASSAGLAAAATSTLVVRSQVPGGPTLDSPAAGADSVALTPTFRWSEVSQSTSYTLEVFDGQGCAGSPVRVHETVATSVTLAPGDALAPFHAWSWRVTASNACGNSTGRSACASFRTASCSAPQDAISNGSFEAGLVGWMVGQSVPPPAVTGDQPHSGTSAIRLGDVSGVTVSSGDSQISQIVSLPAGTSPALTFWEWPHSDDVVAFDQQYVLVTPVAPPGPSAVLMSEARNDQVYLRRELDLSAFAGQTVEITFGVHQDFIAATGMYIDDVGVTFTRCGPPQFALHVTPPVPEEVCAGASLAFGIAVESVNGPNFTSPVTLSVGHLPPRATARFARNPIGPGQSTTLTVTTVRPTAGTGFDIDVTAAAVTPPPAGPQTVTTTLLVDPGAPTAPEIVAPRAGEINVPRRPTLSWTAPFVPGASFAGSPPRPAGSAAARQAFLWELAASRLPGTSVPSPRPATPPDHAAAGAPQAVRQLAFGASSYHIQIARDAAFRTIIVDTVTAEPSFTVASDLEIATQYFWRVSAGNACGTSAFSPAGSFIVGACFEGWAAAPSYPADRGAMQATVIASPLDNKLYVIGGGLGFGPDTRIDQVWAFDPEAGSWTRKADVPAPGVGTSYGAAARIGGTIYVFGGLLGPPGPITAHRALWRYDIAADRWTRGADLPVDNFGAAVAAIDGKIYLAYGSGFANQTWQYDPVRDTYARKADAPPLAAQFRLHGAAVTGELHAFAGGFEGNAHVIYNPVTNTWREAPAMPFPATDPAVDVLAGKLFVVGGRPVAHTQIFDPVTGAWSLAAPIADSDGLDNTAGAVLGPAFHVIGGFDGSDGVNQHWRFHACSLGQLASATMLPLVVDGNGKVAGVGNERTALVIDNSVSGAAMSVTGFLYGTGGEVLGHDTFQVAANELRTVSDVVRALTHTTTVQNKIGSVVVFGTEVFHGMASIVNNTSADPALVDGQPIAGGASGFVSTVGSSGYATQTVFANPSTSPIVLQLLAYPPGGGAAPLAATVAVVPAHGLASYPDVVARLGLGPSFAGQLSWTSSQPMTAMARDLTRNALFSGAAPVHTAADLATTVVVPYVADTTELATALEISNPGPITANVTVHLLDVGDDTGATTGVERTRDVAVAVNSAAPIANIVRWVRRDAATTPSGRHGFLVVTSPQPVTAQARIVDRASLDPAIPDSGAVTDGFSPLLVRVEPLTFSAAGAAASATTQSRFALSNPGTLPATVQVLAYNATGSAASSQPFRVTLAGHGQFYTDNLAATMGLPLVFVGWVTIESDVPIGVYNQRRTGDAGSAVPLHRP